jgi:hypothetical protein
VPVYGILPGRVEQIGQPLRPVHELTVLDQRLNKLTPREHRMRYFALLLSCGRLAGWSCLSRRQRGKFNSAQIISMGERVAHPTGSFDVITPESKCVCLPRDWRQR